MPSLNDEDQKKVDEYNSTGYNSVERGPFRMWFLLLIIFIVLGGMTGVSFLIGYLEGTI